MSTTIQSNLRETKQQSVLTQMRNEGTIPAVVYGYKTETTAISVKERDLLNTLREVGRNGVMKLSVNGEELNVVLSDYQEDPLKGKLLHADFLSINMTEELEVEVAIQLVGESIGEKEGGIVQQPNREVTIRVKPKDIPETFDLDVSELQIGETITVADIREKSKFDILNDDDHALVLISAPRTEEDEEAADESASAEPEVIGEASKEA